MTQSHQRIIIEGKKRKTQSETRIFKVTTGRRVKCAVLRHMAARHQTGLIRI